jgi:cytochrome oxidase Cu insertion factor (SCO1/SenC/PrrC family)
MSERKCDLCGREFSSDQGLLQHYTDKHPGASLPKGVAKREALRKKKIVNSSSSHKQKKILIVSAIVILIIIIASVGVYYSSFSGKATQHDSTDTTSGILYGINSGDHAPNMTVTLVNGTSTTLSRFAGSTVLLYFVATWCPSCQQAAQLLQQQYYSELHTKGVVILTIELYNDLNQQGPSIQQFANQYAGGTGKLGWLFGTSTQSATYAYDSSANLEAYYLINSSGVIVMTTGSSGLANNLPAVVNAA